MPTRPHPAPSSNITEGGYPVALPPPPPTMRWGFATRYRDSAIADGHIT